MVDPDYEDFLNSLAEDSNESLSSARMEDLVQRLHDEINFHNVIEQMDDFVEDVHENVNEEEELDGIYLAELEDMHDVEQEINHRYLDPFFEITIVPSHYVLELLPIPQPFWMYAIPISLNR